VELLAEYADVPAALGLYLGSAFVECVTDLPAVPAGELYSRQAHPKSDVGVEPVRRWCLFGGRVLWSGGLPCRVLA